MGKNKRRKTAVRGSGNYLGRVKGCDKTPGPGSCFKQMHDQHNGKCRHCMAEAVIGERIKVFGR